MRASRKWIMDSFLDEISRMIHIGEEKGYDRITGGMELETRKHHALGEVLYKVQRYQKKGMVDDLIKIAAWAFVLYEMEIEKAQEMRIEKSHSKFEIEPADVLKKEMKED